MRGNDAALGASACCARPAPREVHLRISSPPWRWPLLLWDRHPLASRSSSPPTTPSTTWRAHLGGRLAGLHQHREPPGGDRRRRRLLRRLLHRATTPRPFPRPSGPRSNWAGPSRLWPRTRAPSPESERGPGRAPPMPAPVWTVRRVTPRSTVCGRWSAASAASVGSSPSTPSAIRTRSWSPDRRCRHEARGGPGHRSLRARRHRPGCHVCRRPRVCRGPAAVHARLHRDGQDRPSTVSPPSSPVCPRAAAAKPAAR